MGQAQSANTDSETNKKRENTMATEHASQMSGFFPLSDFPDDILEEILLRLPTRDLVSSCVYVCRRWRDIINSQTLWKEKCKRDYYYTDEMIHDTCDFKQLYFKNPYNSNLVKNPCAKEGFSHWNITRNGGDRFLHETSPAGSHPVKNFAKCDIDGPVGCWVTSFFHCQKEQEIDLVGRGCSPRILDSVRPDICVSEWYAARFDCGCKYRIEIRLLDCDRKILDSYKFEDTKGAGRDWFQISHVFTGYPPGCRFIKYIHGGKDTQFWAGHYGVKITLSSVKFDFSHVAGPYEGKPVQPKLQPEEEEEEEDFSDSGTDEFYDSQKDDDNDI